ncbi:MAG TPA: adenylyltransferase/cytidyltransferase family protein [Candidatus Paceibacterota bacterium]|nr:adenylyltransferase/cytidyltransferase family protein [Candidatus Paceibacterota bacterium]
MRAKKVFVSGCYDMLHSGHVCFLETAACYGDLHICIGSDKTVRDLKGRFPVNTQDERKYMLKALKCVKDCRIGSGSGHLDFLAELKRVGPDIFVVNEDGNSPAKAALCRELGIEYVVFKRIPHANLPARSTTSLRKECLIPYRLDLAGGWLDQPSVSKFGAGPVLTISLEPTMEFNERSGLATSSRKRAIELWQTDLPGGDREKLAKVLFSYENPPGTTEFSGSQDSIGLVFPGLNRLDYRGAFWPEKITSVRDPNTLRWLEQHLSLVTLGPRRSSFRVRSRARITPANVRALARAADRCWSAILDKDLNEFGRQFRNSFEAQIRLFPKMMTPDVRAAIRQYAAQSAGWKLSGAGGGGYLVLVGEGEIPGAIRIKIRSEP